jgi:hypothetical protein
VIPILIRKEISSRSVAEDVRDALREITKAAAAPAPVEVTVQFPDTIRTVSAETETVAERNAEGLVTRSITRATRPAG